MLTTTLALALSLGLLADPGSTPPPKPAFPVDAAGTSRDFDKPPPASPADTALWQKCHDLNNDLVVAQYTATHLQARAKDGRYIERLRDPAGRGKLSAEAAEALAKKVHDTWLTSANVMMSGWPVSKTRVCRYEQLNFEGVLLSDPSPQRENQLEDVRRDVKACVGKAETVAELARKSSAELEAAIEEAHRAIGPPPPPKATAASDAPAAPAKKD
jgi:hypothetical protein